MALHGGKTGRVEQVHHVRRAAVLLLTLPFLLQEVSSTNPYYSSTSTFFHNPPIQIGISTSPSLSSPAASSSSPPLQSRGGNLQQSRRRQRPRKFRSLLAFVSTGNGENTQQEASLPESAANSAAAADLEEDIVYDEDEWKALLENNDHNPYGKHAAASRKSMTTTTRSRNLPCRSEYEAMCDGFRHSLSLPAFLSKEEEIAYGDYEEARVVPCAAVAVSSSKAPASFSSSMSSSAPSRTESKMNKRKDASRPQTVPQFTDSSTSSKSSSSSSSAIINKGRPLVFWENMFCGAVSRSVAQTIMHPANTMKTILQQSNAPPMSSFLQQPQQQLPVLFRGAGANFILSVPHGAINFAVLELVRKELARSVRRVQYLADREDKLGPAMDFLSSAISTICCSVVSTPQMMITDNIMAGNYANLPQAVRGLAAQGTGLSGFYARGWWPGLVGKIPSYALTWTFFQQLKEAQKRLSGREATNAENSIMGCIASGTCVCIMIPMDTIKTRLVTQASKSAAGAIPYKGIVDCAVRIAKEEGASAFYRGLPPRLVSVVPMIGIQFTVYEFMKRVMQKRALEAKAEQQQAQPVPLVPSRFLMGGNKKSKDNDNFDDPYGSFQILQEASMEVAASPEHPYPAPRFMKIMRKKSQNEKRKKNQ